MKFNSYDFGLLSLFGMLLFSVIGLVETEKELDRAKVEISRLQARPLVASAPNPAEICPPWWFGKSKILEVRNQICGTKKKAG